MGRSPIAFVFILFPVFTGAYACNTEETAHPPTLGNCIATPDASCPAPVSGLGSGSGPSGDAAASSDAAISSEAGVCGVADSLVSTSNLSCEPCILSSCCMADSVCSANASCLALTQCAIACASGDQTCIGNCYNREPNGTTDYGDFAACLLSQCSPECPTLPTQAPGDF